MATTPLNTIKNWFKTGLKPIQVQFWSWMDSFWHKDETIPQNKIQNLDADLLAKADAEDLDGKLNSGGYPTQHRLLKMK